MSVDPKGPIPFEIVEEENMRVASNGTLRLVVLGGEGKVFRRRAVTGIQTRPPAEILIPQLNALATELLSRPDMPAHEAVGRVMAVAGMVPMTEPKRVEWVVGELHGVRVYTDGANVLMTTEDLKP